MPATPDGEFTEFVQVALPDLRRTAYLMCGDWHRAEDAAQEALIRLYQGWHRVERAEGRLAYARRTTVRILIDESRRPWRRETSMQVPDTRRHEPVAYDDRDVVVRALLALSPGRRACVVLRYYLDLSVADTARALGCSEGTVKRQTSDGLRALRPLLSDLIETGAHDD